MSRNHFGSRRRRAQEKERAKAAEVRQWKRDYNLRIANKKAPEEFAIEFPRTLSPWGQSNEMDELIARAQSASPVDDRKFLGVTVERCMKATRIQLHVAEGVTQRTVVLVANIISPRDCLSRRGDTLDRAPWKWDKRSLITELENGYLVTLFA